MFTAADLIQALQRRLQLRAPHLRRPPGEFPPGWKQWFEAMPVRAGAISGATAQALIDVFLQRPLTDRPLRSGELTRWQAFNTLWRQDWHAPEPEDRKLRWFAGAFTAMWHVVFGILLLWFWYTQMLYVEEATKRRGEQVVQIEFIGRGTPEEAGGGQTQEQLEESEAAEQVASAQPAEVPPPEQPAPGIETPVVDAPVPEIEQRDVPEPQIPPAPPTQQEVAVSAPTPDASEFVLTAPTPRITEPQLRAPEIRAPAAPLQAVEVPEPVQPIRREVAPRPVAAPQIEARIPEVAQREVAAPLARPAVPAVAAPAIAQPTLRTPETSVRTRDVPAPAAPTPAPAATAQTPSTKPAASSASSATPSTKPAASGPPASSTATTARPSGATPSVTAGQGPKPIAAPGGFATPAKADDWGASTRNAPGGQRGEPHGLYNAEGGPRLAEQPVNTGQPPGTIDDRIVDLDRSGTWLKRKPTDYEPTTFDKYWVPNESLLAEWVRKGIKKMAIPIPGTNKKISCVVSMLALGGACSISDPNLNDQPAEARPPPDVPFKPHLQEDNGSVKPKEGG
ncbi:hypothetical protein [Lysobacter sp. Root494]|uniref:hypothetical protein n=1 Tax=Lysobacter sp. Root494 TaxID=1736549 RepID=UPI0006FAB856|nr:hypothetical protein [Lysobacter sp. Root494]KQY52385.1 hypothetical protein ASD14_07075 [Lysobacter sp. Root494]